MKYYENRMFHNHTNIVPVDHVQKWHAVVCEFILDLFLFIIVDDI